MFTSHYPTSASGSAYALNFFQELTMARTVDDDKLLYLKPFGDVLRVVSRPGWCVLELRHHRPYWTGLINFSTGVL